MTLMHIRLELARTSEFPDGNAERGYELVAPLERDGHIDTAAWKNLRERCEVVRFFDGERSVPGRLRRVGRGWQFDFDATRQDDDEAIFKLDRHPLLPGNYVSITETVGGQQPFRVVSVTPVVGALT